MRDASRKFGKYLDKIEAKLTTKRQQNAKEQHELHCFSLMKEEGKFINDFGGGLGRVEGCDCTTYCASELMLSTGMQPLYIRSSPPQTTTNA